jgi:hypothetical protein
MTIRLCLALALLTGLAAPTVQAHDKFKIVGTVAAVKGEELAVKAVDGATYEMDFPESAPVMRNIKKVGRGELKPGTPVVVMALGHDMFDLEVTEVQIQER